MSDFKTFLQELSDLKKTCTIKFRSVEGALSEIQARITEMTNEGGRDIIETDAGISIGVDQIVAVNERSAENYC